MPAFSQADSPVQPYENERFLKAYATLQLPSSHSFENVSLRDALKNIELSTGIAIWLDRNVDGDQDVQLKAAPAKRSHLECMDELCNQTHTEIAWLENILYIAPPNQSARIEMAYWSLFIDRHSDEWQKKGTAFRWSQVRPADSILNEAARRLPFRLDQLDAVEHDIWGAGSVPEASLAAQWTCLLAGFGRSIASESPKRWFVRELPVPSDVEFVYRQQLKKHTPAKLQEWRGKWPQAKVIRNANGTISVAASVAAHRELMLAGPMPKLSSKTGDLRHTLQFRGELGNLLDALGQQLSIEFSPMPLPNAWRHRPIDLQIKEATLDQVLDAIAKQADLELRRAGRQVTVEEKKGQK